MRDHACSEPRRDAREASFRKGLCVRFLEVGGPSPTFEDLIQAAKDIKTEKMQESDVVLDDAEHDLRSHEVHSKSNRQADLEANPASVGPCNLRDTYAHVTQ